MCEITNFRSVPNLQVVVPFLPTLPHKQKRSSSSRHARLGLPSLTLHQSIITYLMHVKELIKLLSIFSIMSCAVYKLRLPIWRTIVMCLF